MAKHNELGKLGEEEAAKYLLKKGYTIATRNYRFQKAEIDIIAQKNDLLVAIEVKTRSTDDFGDPQEFIKPQQIKRIVTALDHYITQHEIEAEIRFDVIAIIKNQKELRIKHLEDAFYYFG